MKLIAHFGAPAGVSVTVVLMALSFLGFGLSLGKPRAAAAGDALRPLGPARAPGQRRRPNGACFAGPGDTIFVTMHDASLPPRCA
jgi:hypothetical protein